MLKLTSDYKPAQRILDAQHELTIEHITKLNTQLEAAIRKDPEIGKCLGTIDIMTAAIATVMGMLEIAVSREPEEAIWLVDFISEMVMETFPDHVKKVAVPSDLVDKLQNPNIELN